MKNLSSIFTCILLLTGCTFGGASVTEKDLSKSMICTDTRDGEIFRFNTNSITNIRTGFGTPTTMDLITDTGEHKTISSNMETWLKCKKI